MRTALLLVLNFLVVPAFGAGPERVFEFTYELLATEFPRGESVDIYVPLAIDDQGQRILREDFDASMPGQRGQEAVYGNTYYHLRREPDSEAAITATFQWTVARAAVSSGDDNGLSAEEMALYLGPNNLVPVDHEILEPIRREIRSRRLDDTKSATARAIYDWVVENVEYKKVGTGWGNGDTFWACNERYGNCTDFHALFISLARSEGIPARFEIGFPVPGDRVAGDIGGYHCWVKFYLPGEGWIPIDASEAAKHPEKRELLYGSQPADRIHFTTGRDLVLDASSQDQSLNYFIYPYVEVGGRPWQGRVATRFSFREISDPLVSRD